MLKNISKTNTATKHDLSTEPHVIQNNVDSVFKRNCVTLINFTLETWVHQLLYVRMVYPPDTFTISSFLGIRCYVCRHPDVDTYITETLKIVVPSLMSNVANEISFIITDDVVHIKSSEYIDNEERSDFATTVTTEEMEVFVLRVADLSSDLGLYNTYSKRARKNSPEPSIVMNQCMQKLERSMRDLMLSVYSLEVKHDHNMNMLWTDAVSFRITLYIPVENQTCQELNNVFQQGKWHATNNSNTTFSTGTDGNAEQKAKIGRVIRPLYQTTTPVGKFHFLMKQVSKSKKKVVIT